MNETQINAQFAALAEQRNNAMNTVVNQAGVIARLEAQVKDLTEKLEYATTILPGTVVVEEDTSA